MVEWGWDRQDASHVTPGKARARFRIDARDVTKMTEARMAKGVMTVAKDVTACV